MFQIEKKLFLTVKKKSFWRLKNRIFPKWVNPVVLVKKCQFFHYLFLFEIRLEIRFKNVLDRKKTSFDCRKKKSRSHKLHFSKGVNPCFWTKKCLFFFHFFFLIKIRLEIRFNNILKRKQTLFDHKNKIFHSPKNRIFPTGLTHAFGQKMPLFSLFVFA